MAIIDIENVTNTEKTGIFDKLMQSINENIENQFRENRITGSDYATVYLGSMQAALAQSIQFSLQEDLVEAQIDSVLADNLLKADQLLTSGVDRSLKTFELENILPEQVLKIQEEIDILQTQDSELLLDGVAKRLIMAEEVQSADLQQIILQTEEELKTAQLAEVTASTTRSDTELSDSLLTTAAQRLILAEDLESANLQQLLFAEQTKNTYTDRILKDKQAAKLGMDNVMRLSEENRQSDINFVYAPNYEGV
jgi:hypothetical protein